MEYRDDVTDEEHAEFVGFQQKSAEEDGLVSCVCGNEIALHQSFRCLYCGIWWCEPCAENHFGQTVEEYHGNKQTVLHTESK